MCGCGGRHAVQLPGLFPLAPMPTRPFHTPAASTQLQRGSLAPCLAAIIPAPIIGIYFFGLEQITPLLPAGPHAPCYPSAPPRPLRRRLHSRRLPGPAADPDAPPLPAPVLRHPHAVAAAAEGGGAAARAGGRDHSRGAGAARRSRTPGRGAVGRVCVRVCVCVCVGGGGVITSPN